MAKVSTFTQMEQNMMGIGSKIKWKVKPAVSPSLTGDNILECGKTIRFKALDK